MGHATSYEKMASTGLVEPTNMPTSYKAIAPRSGILPRTNIYISLYIMVLTKLRNIKEVTLGRLEGFDGSY
jgi:hypothetical protein